MYNLAPTKRFGRHRKKLPRNVQEDLKECLRTLAIDPRHPSLKSHAYKSIKGVFESYINNDGWRILWEYDKKNKCIIVLLAAGDHDML